LVLQFVQCLQSMYAWSMPENNRAATLRERRKQETRDEIRRIALELVQGRGYEAVTVDLISERAGVSMRTFFNYFANKESAMVAIPPAIPDSAADQFLSRSGPHELFADLADLAVNMFVEGASGPSDFESSIQIVMAVPTLATLQQGALAEREAQFVELIATRLTLATDDAQPAVIAAAFVGAIRVACQRWSRTRAQRTFAEEVRACVTLLRTASPNHIGSKPTRAARNH
jgi:AcrR family transcriptional regulator